MTYRIPLLLIGSLIAMDGSAFAQAPPTTPAAPPAATAPAPNATGRCAPTEARPQDGTLSSRDEKAENSGKSLSDKLAQSDGVLCPPRNVDPEMHAPAPNVGNTPVIPPPGSPGGDQTVRPK